MNCKITNPLNPPSQGGLEGENSLKEIKLS